MWGIYGKIFLYLCDYFFIALLETKLAMFFVILVDSGNSCPFLMIKFKRQYMLANNDVLSLIFYFLLLIKSFVAFLLQNFVLYLTILSNFLLSLAHSFFRYSWFFLAYSSGSSMRILNSLSVNLKFSSNKSVFQFTIINIISIK